MACRVSRSGGSGGSSSSISSYWPLTLSAGYIIANRNLELILEFVSLVIIIDRTRDHSTVVNDYQQP